MPKHILTLFLLACTAAVASKAYLDYRPDARASQNLLAHSHRHIDAEDFGISPTESAALNATNFNAKIGANSAVGRIHFGPGVFNFDRTLIVDRDGLIIECDGVNQTTLNYTGTSGTFLLIGAGSTLRSGIKVRDCALNTTALTSGKMIYFNKTFNSGLDNVWIKGSGGGSYAVGIDLFAAQLTTLRDVYLTNATSSTGKFISARSDGTSSNLIMDNVATDGGKGLQPLAGLYIEQWDGIFADKSQFNRSGSSIYFNVPTGKTFDHLYANNLSLDTSAIDAVTIKNGGGAVRRLYFNNSWFGSSDNNGIRVEANAFVTGLRILNSRVANNGSYGIYFETGNIVRDVQIVGSAIQGNSTSSSGKYAGIFFGGGTYQNVQIVGTKIGFSDEFSNTQGYGLNFAASGVTINQFQLRANDIDGNTIAPVHIANFQTATFNKMDVGGNIGFDSANIGK